MDCRKFENSTYGTTIRTAAFATIYYCYGHWRSQ
jgi:hypothetical protein